MRIIPYIFNMADAIAASDIVISRAGAITVSEITACGKAAILIPSPNVTNNHQEFNAEALRKRGAALVIKENDLNGEVLYNKIKNLLNEKSRLKDMSMNSLKLGKVDATEKIVDLILKNNPLN
jgi:UDP-N-acetylglucosamine--N-acetylmuramyl-(pentapeptide) pyrophosphoryl-undecaprenol N-acetylglucosamine transferase